MSDGTVLIVDDEPAIRKLLVRVAANSGFDAVTASNGREAVMLGQDKKIDLILLDIMMNGNEEGFDVIRRLRDTGNNTPIIVLSGRTEDFDTLYGLELGADDYVGKPFNPVVLGAKMKALIRRDKKFSDSPSDYICAGPFRYNSMTMELFKDKLPIPLSSRENVLMKLFLCNTGRVFTQEQLYEQVWNGTGIDKNTIMVYISHLRNKIEDDPKNPQYIKTLWGLGYKFSVKEYKKNVSVS